MSDKFDCIASDITNNCNLRCTFCFNDFSGVKNHFITDEMFDKVISLLPLVEDGNFFFSCLYEPSIHPRFIDLLERIPQELRRKVFFTTNLTTKITDETLDRLSTIGIHHINISIDSFKPEVFESLRIGAKFERYINNLERLVGRFAANTGAGAPPIHYVTVVLRPNIGEIPAIVKECSTRFLAAINEARWIYWGSHEQPAGYTMEWKQRFLASNKQWKKLEKFGRKTKYNFLLDAPPPNYFEHDGGDYSRVSEGAEWATLPLGLSVGSNGKAYMIGHPEVSFDLADIDDPLGFFQERVGELMALPRTDFRGDTMYG